MEGGFHASCGEDGCKRSPKREWHGGTGPGFLDLYGSAGHWWPYISSLVPTPRPLSPPTLFALIASPLHSLQEQDTSPVNMATLLSELCARTRLDCDTMDLDFAREFGPFADCTSNQVRHPSPPHAPRESEKLTGLGHLVYRGLEDHAGREARPRGLHQGGGGVGAEGRGGARGGR